LVSFEPLPVSSFEHPVSSIAASSAPAAISLPFFPIPIIVILFLLSPCFYPRHL
jgi:hypothetical protein